MIDNQDEHADIFGDSLEKYIAEQDRKRENRYFVSIILWSLALVACIVLVIFLLVPTKAEAYQGIGTGFIGSGTVVKEEPKRFGLFESYSVTEDKQGYGGMTVRDTTYFDCRDDYLGNKVCSERHGW